MASRSASERKKKAASEAAHYHASPVPAADRWLPDCRMQLR
jgi:hypothetical protein